MSGMKPRFLLGSCEPYYFLDEGNRYDEEEETNKHQQQQQQQKTVRVDFRQL